MKYRFALAAMAVAVAGCTSLLHPAGPTGGVSGTIRVRAVVPEGPYMAQAVVKAYKKADIDHVVVKLLDSSDNPVTVNSAEVKADIASGSLSTEITFGNLRQNTTYKIKGFAYKAAGTAEADLISVTADSVVTVSLTNDDRPAIAQLPLILKSATFAGFASSSFDVVAGSLKTNGNPQTTVATPTPEPTPTPTPEPTPSPTEEPCDDCACDPVLCDPCITDPTLCV